MKPINLTPTEIFDITESYSNGVRYYILQKKYNQSWYNLKKIIRLFPISECDTLDKVSSAKEKIDNEPRLRDLTTGRINHALNYSRYRDYYSDYHKKWYKRKRAVDFRSI